MRASFIPLAPQATSAPAPRLNPHVGSQTVPAIRPFQPLTLPAAPSTSVPEPPPAAERLECAGAPTILAQKRDDQITHLRIQCKCGEVIEVECIH